MNTGTVMRTENFLMACRYAYYVLGESIISDYQYDTKEKEFTKITDRLSPILTPGSDRECTYTPYQKELAEYLVSVNHS